MALGGVTGQRVLAIFIFSCEREKRVLGLSFPGQKLLLFLHCCYGVEMGSGEEPLPYE